MVANTQSRQSGTTQPQSSSKNRSPNALVGLVIGLCLVFSTGIGLNKMQKGKGGTEVTGSGGPNGSSGASADLVTCPKPIGIAALVEPRTTYYHHYGLSSPASLLKLMMAQSNCFRIVDRGAGNRAMERERAIAAKGEFQKGSNMGKGQMVAADYVITPQIVYKDKNAGGAGGGLGGLLPGRAGALAGRLKSKRIESQVMLSLTDVRTGVQEVTAEGSARKTDLDLRAIGWIRGIPAVGGGGAWESTDIGKVTAAAFMDAHNNMVAQLGGLDDANVDNAGWVVAAAVNFRTGPSKTAPVLTKLIKGTNVIATGSTRGDWWEIEAFGNTGWIHSDYLTR